MVAHRVVETLFDGWEPTVLTAIRMGRKLTCKFLVACMGIEPISYSIRHPIELIAINPNQQSVGRYANLQKFKTKPCCHSPI